MGKVAIPRGFQPVLSGVSGQYTKGFDKAKKYHFWRAGWQAPKSFRMEDMDPLFNVAGLYFKEGL